MPSELPEGHTIVAVGFNLRKTTAISYHIVFCTQNRTPVLKRDRREDLLRYIWGIIKNRRSHIYRIDGVEGPLHSSLACFPRSAWRTSQRRLRPVQHSGSKRTGCSEAFRTVALNSEPGDQEWPGEAATGGWRKRWQRSLVTNQASFQTI